MVQWLRVHDKLLLNLSTIAAIGVVDCDCTLRVLLSNGKDVIIGCYKSPEEARQALASLTTAIISSREQTVINFQ
ncbi:hypothetical protein [Caldanaerobius polysaccharolyticus]|uniref:hypothetical protein n=1 Tax=Caldanaerobius polysaccharolyticus TaxID=44256 RepID=UPI00047C2845|nr:hypothetical protein [Caldanaerobius polysaccharolyticus]